jgi:hypothetical protein
MELAPTRMEVRAPSFGECEDRYARQVFEAGHDKNEHVVVWDRTGEAKYTAAGDTNGIRTGDRDFRGMSMVHNHPSGSSFSGADLRSAQKFGLGSTSVVDDRYIYTLTPGAGRATFAQVPTDIGAVWDKAFEEATGPHGRGWNGEQSSAAMEQVAKQTGMNYSRRER